MLNEWEAAVAASCKNTAGPHPKASFHRGRVKCHHMGIETEVARVMSKVKKTGQAPIKASALIFWSVYMQLKVVGQSATDDRFSSQQYGGPESPAQMLQPNHKHQVQMP